MLFYKLQINFFDRIIIVMQSKEKKMPKTTFTVKYCYQKIKYELMSTIFKFQPNNYNL